MKAFRQLMLAASIGVALLSSPAQAITTEEIANPRPSGGWVSDHADLISAESEAKINQLLTDLEAVSGTEMAVVTVADTDSFNSPKAFATELFNTWGVGKAEQNNGVLLLVSVGDHRTEVEVGSGLTTTLTQSKIEALLEENAVPAFQAGNFDQGIVATSQALVAQLQPSTVRVLFSLLADRPIVAAIILLWGGVVILLVLYPLFRRLRPHYSQCPQCHERTLAVETVQVRSKRPSASKSKQRVTQACHACGYRTVETLSAAQAGAVLSNSNGTRSTYGSSFSGGASDGNASSDSFGGGSSSGGGGGASW